jgi:hypothetical protein
VNRDGLWLVYHRRTGRVEEVEPEVGDRLLTSGSHVVRPGGKPGEYQRPDGAPQAWTLAISPEEYLARYPDGPNAELARAVLDG